MTYEKFLKQADDHINEVVICTVLFKNDGRIHKTERINRGAKDWVKQISEDSLIEIVNMEWTGKIIPEIKLSKFVS